MTKTEQAIRRIAELKIQYLGLNDTPEEYIKKCHEKQREKEAKR